MIEDWQETRIEDIAERIAMGPFGSDIKVDNFVPQGVPIIRGGNLSSGRFNDDNFVYLTEEKADKLSAANAFQDDIVFTHRGTLGQVGIIPKTKFARYVVSQSQMKLTCKTNLAAPPFIYYFFKSNIGQQALLINTSQTGVPAISRPVTSLKNITILLPSLPEQRRIAHILGTLDDKIENNRKTAKTLEAMAQAIFKSWFVDFDPVRAKMAGESRESICKRLKLTPEILDLFPDRLVDSELGEIPEGWGVKSLDSIGNFLNGLAMQKFPSSGQDDALPVIKIAQLRAGDLTCADQASREIESQFVIHDGDILFSWSGSLECVLWSGGIGALNQHLFKVTPKSNYPRWLCYFGIHHFLEFFREIAAGKATTMGHIQRHHLSDTKLALPCASNLDTMNKPIQFIFEAMWMRAVEARKLSSLRDTLLPKLISGEIRVPEAEDLVQEATR